MSDIEKKIAKARKHTGGGKYDYAVNDIIDILEILAQPLKINGYVQLLVERDTYKALVEKRIQAQPEPDTENLANRLTAALQENAMLNGIWRAADKENDKLRGFVEKFLTLTAPKGGGALIDLSESELWELIHEAGEIRGEQK